MLYPFAFPTQNTAKSWFQKSVFLLVSLGPHSKFLSMMSEQAPTDLITQSLVL